MDKNQLIGVFLIFLLLIGYTYVNAPSPEELAEQKRIQDSIAMASQIPTEEIVKEETTIQQETNPTLDSLQQAQYSSSFGLFANNATGDEKDFFLENEKIKIRFSNKGGFITEATLKDYDKIKKDSTGSQVSKVKLLEDPKNRFEYELPVPSAANGVVKTGDLFFDVSQSDNQITFSAQLAQGARFEQSYTLNASYELDYKVNLIGLKQILSPNAEHIPLRWRNYLDRIENNWQFEKRYSTVYYKEVTEGSADYCSCTGDDETELENKVKWVSHVNQFFNTSLVATNKSFEDVKLTTTMLSDEEDDMKRIDAEMLLPYGQSQQEEYAMKLYVGPNEYSSLKDFHAGVEEILPFGVSIVGTINRHVIRPFFNFLSQFIGPKGIVIIVLIFIIKMLLYPLMYKMLHSQAKMQALKPEIAKLTEKYKDEPQKKQMETMKIYREYSVSPFGGCMPMVLQMPIWYALFRFFPASITFRQESFLWADDLSSYDAFFNLPFELPLGMGAHISLFTLLWAATTLIYTYYNTKHMDMSANPAMKYVQYLMPVMFLGFFNSYASGLTCYMFFSNIFNILQTVLTKRFVFDQDKIKAQLDIQKAKPKKKSGFQARLEEAMRQQQQAQQKKKRK